MSDKKVLIFRRNNQIITSLMHDRTMLEVYVNDEKQKSLIGNLYVGRVQNIVKNIDAAFVEIDKGLVCYLPLQDLKNPLFTNRNGQNASSIEKKPLCIGDELVVQVTRDALKTKQPAVTTNFSLAGDYVVLNHGENGLGISSKLINPLKEKIKKYLTKNFDNGSITSSCGIVVRTNAETLQEEEYIKIWEEILSLENLYKQILAIAPHRPAFTKLYSKSDLFGIEAIYQTAYDEIVTDQEDIFHVLNQAKQNGALKCEIRFYQDENLSLINLYSIESRLKEALETRIWLKSGGYLVIEPTEALTVIDVNTGKFDAKATYRDTILKINLEAAEEIAHQIRLRNLSGIIIVDFINMEFAKDVELLLNKLKVAVSYDPIKTNIIGITKLGLVEITRKKKNKTLKEQLQGV